MPLVALQHCHSHTGHADHMAQYTLGDLLPGHPDEHTAFLRFLTSCASQEHVAVSVRSLLHSLSAGAVWLWSDCHRWGIRTRVGQQWLSIEQLQDGVDPDPAPARYC